MLYGAVLSVFLQGCVVWTPLPDACLPLPFSVLNHTDGIISETLAGQIPDIQCPAGLIYAGPKLECGMRAKVCLAEKLSYIDKRRCFYEYEFVVLGTALKTWPDRAKPILMNPFLSIADAKMQVHANRTDMDLEDIDFTEEEREDEFDEAMMALGMFRRLKTVLPHVVETDELRCIPVISSTPVIPGAQASFSLPQNILRGRHARFGGDQTSFLCGIGFVVAGLLSCAIVCRRRRAPTEDEPNE